MKLICALLSVFLVANLCVASETENCPVDLMIPKLEATSLEVKGKTYQVRPAVKADIPVVTKLIHDAFSVWKDFGLTLSPMKQTDETTGRHLIPNGYVVEDGEGSIVATFSLTTGQIGQPRGGRIAFTEGADEPLPFVALSDAEPHSAGLYLVFKKFAVARSLAGQGLGSALYKLVEALGRKHAFLGMAIETVKEAPWLYGWYEKLGYFPIGRYRYASSALDTILMVKPLGVAKP